MHTVLFLLAYPELSRDRLAVTQCCPATSDPPENSKRADPWLTTEIQLPNQAGRQEREKGEDRGKGGRGEKIKPSVCYTVALHQACLIFIPHSFVLYFLLLFHLLPFTIIYILHPTTMSFLLDCIHFMVPAVKDKTQRRKRCSKHGWVQ